MKISLREAKETKYWLKIIREMNLCDRIKVQELIQENLELIKITTTIITNTQKKKNKGKKSIQ